MRRFGWLLLLAACKFSSSLGGDDGAPKDGPPDAEIDAPPPDAFDDKCFGSGAFYVCLPAGPTGSESLDDDNSISTTTCNATKQSKIMLGTTPVCAVIADTITLSAGQDVGVVGNLPLVLIAVTSITLNGNIDVSSVRSSLGPNANPAQCNNTGIDGMAALASTGGGGAGGTFGSRGGTGGLGGSTLGGVAAVVPPKSSVLRGGCKGGIGNIGAATLTAAGGPGGGAVYLVSRGTITVNAQIDATGGGGEGGRASKGGGGGGGSGGMIVFHAATLMIGPNARINANGGGGGGGAGNVDDGDNGADPDPAALTTAALGGQTTMSGRSQGGNGATATTNATNGANGASGGGGGGGGTGLIRVLRGGMNFPAGTASPVPVN